MLVDSHEVDRLGRRVPEPVSWPLLFRAVPGLSARFREVPGGYWHTEATGVTVACPCGHFPHIEPTESVKCRCERLYLYAREVWVANSPAGPSRATVD